MQQIHRATPVLPGPTGPSIVPMMIALTNGETSR